MTSSRKVDQDRDKSGRNSCAETRRLNWNSVAGATGKHWREEGSDDRWYSRLSDRSADRARGGGGGGRRRGISEPKNSGDRVLAAAGRRLESFLSQHTPTRDELNGTRSLPSASVRARWHVCFQSKPIALLPSPVPTFFPFVPFCSPFRFPSSLYVG